MIRAMLRTVVLSFPVLGLSGCAGTSTPLSTHITSPPPGNFQLVEAVANPDASIGRLVRWGGEVLEVTSGPAGSYEVVVLERRLGENGQPMYRGPSNGRFLIRATAQVDPSLYRTGTDVTVAGSFAGLVAPTRTTTADLLPLVTVTNLHNWGPAWYADPYDTWPYPHYRYPPYYYGPRYRFGIGIHHGVHRRYPYWPYYR